MSLRSSALVDHPRGLSQVTGTPQSLGMSDPNYNYDAPQWVPLGEESPDTPYRGRHSDFFKIFHDRHERYQHVQPQPLLSPAELERIRVQREARLRASKDYPVPSSPAPKYTPQRLSHSVRDSPSHFQQTPSSSNYSTRTNIPSTLESPASFVAVNHPLSAFSPSVDARNSVSQRSSMQRLSTNTARASSTALVSDSGSMVSYLNDSYIPHQPSYSASPAQYRSPFAVPSSSTSHMAVNTVPISSLTPQQRPPSPRIDKMMIASHSTTATPSGLGIAREAPLSPFIQHPPLYKIKDSSLFPTTLPAHLLDPPRQPPSHHDVVVPTHRPPLADATSLNLVVPHHHPLEAPFTHDLDRSHVSHEYPRKLSHVPKTVAPDQTFHVSIAEETPIKPSSGKSLPSNAKRALTPYRSGGRFKQTFHPEQPLHNHFYDNNSRENDHPEENQYEDVDNNNGVSMSEDILDDVHPPLTASLPFLPSVETHRAPLQEPHPSRLSQRNLPPTVHHPLSSFRASPAPFLPMEDVVMATNQLTLTEDETAQQRQKASRLENLLKMLSSTPPTLHRDTATDVVRPESRPIPAAEPRRMERPPVVEEHRPMRMAPTQPHWDPHWDPRWTVDPAKENHSVDFHETRSFPSVQRVDPPQQRRRREEEPWREVPQDPVGNRAGTRPVEFWRENPENTRDIPPVARVRPMSYEESREREPQPWQRVPRHRAEDPVVPIVERRYSVLDSPTSVPAIIRREQHQEKRVMPAREPIVRRPLSTTVRDPVQRITENTVIPQRMVRRDATTEQQSMRHHHQPSNAHHSRKQEMMNTTHAAATQQQQKMVMVDVAPPQRIRVESQMCRVLSGPDKSKRIISFHG